MTRESLFSKPNPFLQNKTKHSKQKYSKTPRKMPDKEIAWNLQHFPSFFFIQEWISYNGSLSRLAKKFSQYIGKIINFSLNKK
jgi:hypothetical protein